MRYMLLIHTPELAADTEAPGAQRTMSADYAAFNDAMKKAGVFIDGDRLQPSTTAVSVRIEDGKTDVLDGPYADTKEQFGGYYLIDVADMDQAVAWAARCPAAARGTIEVRPIWALQKP